MAAPTSSSSVSCGTPITAGAATRGARRCPPRSRAGGHVAPAADDDLLLAVDDEEVAVLVDARDVARAEPAVGVDRFGRGLRAAPVALHDVVPADQHLAVGVDAHLDAIDRQADRGGRACGLAEPIGWLRGARPGRLALAAARWYG